MGTKIHNLQTNVVHEPTIKMTYLIISKTQFTIDHTRYKIQKTISKIPGTRTNQYNTYKNTNHIDNFNT